jgi:protein phosphatase
MGQIRQVTKDHSLVQMMVDRGELTLQDAKSYPGKNMITRAVGTETAVQCDVFHLQLERGDAMLLCSDGLSNLLDEQEILFEVVYEENGQRCCERLLEIAENRGAPDNVTCVLAKF